MHVFVMQWYQVGGETIHRWKRGPREQTPKTRGDGACALIYINRGRRAYNVKKVHEAQLVR